MKVATLMSSALPTCGRQSPTCQPGPVWTSCSSRRTRSTCAARFFFFFLRGSGSVDARGLGGFAGSTSNASGNRQGATSVRGGLEKASKLEAAGGGGGEAYDKVTPAEERDCATVLAMERACIPRTREPVGACIAEWRSSSAHEVVDGNDGASIAIGCGDASLGECGERRAVEEGKLPNAPTMPCDTTEDVASAAESAITGEEASVADAR
jgi:hypothetical protein